MSLQEQLNTAMKEAMKARDSLRLNAIRLAKSSIKNKEIEARKEFNDQEIIGVLSSLVKQRRESAQLYRDGGREELAAKEEQELAIIQEFLPKQLDETELKAIIDAAVAETGAATIRDMGKVMKIVTAKTVGRADGRLVSELVKSRLS